MCGMHIRSSCGPGTTTGCCGLKGGNPQRPGTTVNNKCPGDPAGFAGDPQWAAMGFSVGEEASYGYSYVGALKNFTAYGIGDTDCDSAPATYTLEGTIDAAGNPSVNLAKPPAGVY